MLCWICNDNANTGEHKVKKSTLNKIFRHEFNNNEMFHYKNDKYTKIQGVNSKKVKYTNNLCAKCNNQLTQPFDIAYDIFFDYIVENYNLISKVRMIDFFDIYGGNFPIMQSDLFKYFIKIFGCDLSDSNFNVPEDLIELLGEELFRTRAKISLSINEDIINIDKPTEAIYGIGSLITSQENIKTRKEINTFYSFSITLSYISVNIFYNCSADIGLGSEWIADKRYLYLGSNPKLENN